MGVRAIENEWDFDVYATRLERDATGTQIRDCFPALTDSHQRPSGLLYLPKPAVHRPQLLFRHLRYKLGLVI